LHTHLFGIDSSFDYLQSLTNENDAPCTTSAEFYGNEAEVGKAIQASGVPREELFLVSKVWTTTIEKGDGAIRAQLEKSEL